MRLRVFSPLILISRIFEMLLMSWSLKSIEIELKKFRDYPKRHTYIEYLRDTKFIIVLPHLLELSRTII
jgi:hypothetical protein